MTTLALVIADLSRPHLNYWLPAAIARQMYIDGVLSMHRSNSGAWNYYEG